MRIFGWLLLPFGIMVAIGSVPELVEGHTRLPGHLSPLLIVSLGLVFVAVGYWMAEGREIERIRARDAKVFPVNRDSVGLHHVALILLLPPIAFVGGVLNLLKGKSRSGVPLFFGSWVPLGILVLISLPLFGVGRPGANRTAADANHTIIEVNLKHLGFFPLSAEMGTIDNVPPDFRKLDGQHVGLEGVIVLDAANDAGTNCQLVYDPQKGSFGGPPVVQERVFLFGQNGRGAIAVAGKARVVGVLHVAVKRGSDRRILSVYGLTVESITPLT